MKRIFKICVFIIAMFFVLMDGAEDNKVQAKTEILPEECFDANWYYLKHYKENSEITRLKNDKEALKNHYYSKGIALGYSPSAVFDPKEYQKLNPDVAKNPGSSSMTGTYQHFVDYVVYGTETRQSSSFFHIKYYASAMAKEMPNTNNFKLIVHYCLYGFYEGRLGANTNTAKAFARVFHFQQYGKYNTDVKKAFGNNSDEGRKNIFGHFVMDTLLNKEGRRSSDNFSIKYYANLIGKSYEDAFWYYINSGYKGENDNTIQTYIISYDANGGSSAPASQKKTIGINLAISSKQPLRTGYTFQGWAVSAGAVTANSSYAPGKSYTANADLTLYAVWKINTYRVTYDLNGGTSSSIAEQTKVFDVDLQLTSVIPRKENYGFAGWGLSADAVSAAYAAGGYYSTNNNVTLYAVWKLNQYMVSYDANGGSGAPEEQVKTYGEVLTLSSKKPVWQGHDFMGWGLSADDNSIAYTYGSLYTEEVSVCLYAIWRVKTYTVQYDVNGGDGSINIPEQMKVYGEELMLSNIEPVRADYGFMGWSVSKDATVVSYKPGAVYKNEADVILYAVWKKDIYSVVYNANADTTGQVTGLPESFEREAGEEILISSEIPVREGYTFQGWKRILEGGTVKYYQAGERYNEDVSLILYAVWGQDSYPVTYYNVDENGEYSQWKTQTKRYDEELQLADTEPLRIGYHFKGWSISEASSLVKYEAGDTYLENKKLDLYAVWELEKYTVSYDANGGSNAPSDQLKKYGEPLKLTISTPYCLGYTFCGWSTRASDMQAEYESGETYSKEADLKLYAVWKKITYTVRYDANGGYFLKAPSEEEKEWGKSLVLSNEKPIRAGWDFAGWSANKEAVTASYAAGGSYSNNEDVILYAVWKVSECTITYDANGGSGEPDTQKKAYNEAVKLSSLIPRRTGYDFIGWSKNREDTNFEYQPEDLYTENVSVTLYAVWKVKQYTVSYNANGGMFTSSIKDDIKYYGQALQLSEKCPVRTGYTFAGWAKSAEASRADYQAGKNYTENLDVVLYAVWEAVQYQIVYDANGGYGAPAAQIKNYGTGLMLSSRKPTRTGYDFLGWSESKSAVTVVYQPGSIYNANKDMTLYAVWQKKAGSIGETPGKENTGGADGEDTKLQQPIQIGKESYTVAVGTKAFSLNVKAGNGEKLTYQSSNPKVVKVNNSGKVTVKKCGTAKIAVTAIGTGAKSSKKVIQITVVPKKQSATVKYNYALHKLMVKWKKDGKTSGYTVCISKSKKFKKTESREYTYGKSVCIRIYTGLKKGTYYIKVRSYKNISGKKYYGEWSRVRKVKVS